MELLRVKSSHSLVTTNPAERPLGENLYTLNCSQYMTTYNNWARRRTETTPAFGIMTLNYEQIYVTDAEHDQIISAIKSANSPITVD